ncbi:MAG: hypothetical protein GY854_21365 [Deltaproteobacteria bacterium]|nr:hypothetical protein [Deltaproteobacteria bacterium]
MLSEYLLWPTSICFLVAVLLLIYIAWLKRHSKERARLKVKDWIDFELPVSILHIMLALTVLWILHQGAYMFAIKRLEVEPQAAPVVKPRFISSDEHKLSQGVSAYNVREYDRALRLFGTIGNLSGPQYVRWKFYEAMANFRKQQYIKAVLRDDVNLDSVRAAITRMEAIIEEHGEDVLYPDAKYWYGQTLRYFMGDEQAALVIFEELLEEFPEGTPFRWREGCEYYSAVILLDQHDPASREKAINTLRTLRNQRGKNLLQAIEQGGRESFRVSLMIDTLARKRQLDELLRRKVAPSAPDTEPSDQSGRPATGPLSGGHSVSSSSSRKNNHALAGGQRHRTSDSRRPRSARRSAVSFVRLEGKRQSRRKAR